MKLLPLAVAITGLAAVTAAPTSAPAHPHPPASIQALLTAHSVPQAFDSQLASYSCPVERGPVKEGADADRAKVATSVTYSSIRTLVGKAKPSSYPTNSRIGPVELRTYQLSNVHIRQYKIETDGDIHLVIKDASGHHMIAEIPYNACVPSRSPWKTRIAAARSGFVGRYKLSTGWLYINRVVSLRGLAMFDPLHGQTGVAANGIELHPVFRILW